MSHMRRNAHTLFLFKRRAARKYTQKIQKKEVINRILLEILCYDVIVFLIIIFVIQFIFTHKLKMNSSSVYLHTYISVFLHLLGLLAFFSFKFLLLNCRIINTIYSLYMNNMMMKEKIKKNS